MTTVVALVLALLATGLKDIHERNEAIYNKKALLTAIESYLENPAKDLEDEEVINIFDQQVQQIVIDHQGNQIEGVLAEDIELAKEKDKPEAERQYPVYVFNSPKGKVYIFSVRGSGLWDAIWGSIAIEDDFSTIAGAAFDHAGETPGLGAEIKDNPSFSAQFVGKKIYEDDGEYVSVTVRKGGAKDPEHEVDGISGATVTGDGVSKMLYSGLKNYEPYIESVQSSNKTSN